MAGKQQTTQAKSVRRSANLGPEERASALATMKDRELDVLVIGGGIVGVGSALDAVTRGLRVGIVEARDFASGTSSRSSKLIHGGIRYLEQGNFGLVREALIERGLLLQRIAPHLVKPVRFLYPLTNQIERAYIGAGMALYDAFSYTGLMRPGVPMHKHLSKKQMLKQIPSLDPNALAGGLTYYDAQVDDARYVAELARTASFYGAHVASRVRAEGFLKVGERVVGIQAHDYETGERFEIRAKQVVNATGVWTGDTQAMVGSRSDFRVRASKGVHLVVPRDRFHSSMGLLLRTEKSVLFVIPWGRHWIIGTTDTDWELDKAHPAATAADIDYILEHVNSVLATKLTRSDVEGVYAGLRPLLAAAEGSTTANLSREHHVSHTVPGLVMIAGGKWTTYRVMAKDAIDEAVSAIDGKVPASCTEDIPLLGAVGYRAAWNKRGKIAKAFGLHKHRVEHLLNRYGVLTDDLLDIIRERPELAEPLPGADDYLGAEVRYACLAEGALHLDDVLARRTRISIEAWDRGVAAAPVAARIMAEVLGWDDERVENEINTYNKRVAAELASQELPDDESADRARLEAPDIVPLGALPVVEPVGTRGT
ncbi:glycerol-3-phosphate dehydrogenase/oxidase [Agrococcus jejuensis]|uniref:Glycerol-3-phosphate dehydrogenase n=1 Tax=Agrococcus jejuensis TaxID=399736 RepID=A0A1G8BGU0_9MICO|nr:glycerol-3-phosphate dehydrogenase/oxidase [Agrococcus jejuensis]SDH32456.1 glycerol-3-phosphate dehydrogenase [Agrococcus jejuensis]